MSKNVKIVFQVRVDTGMADTPLSSYIAGYTLESCRFNSRAEAQALVDELNARYGDALFLPPRFYVMRIVLHPAIY